MAKSKRRKSLATLILILAICYAGLQISLIIYARKENSDITSLISNSVSNRLTTNWKIAGQQEPSTITTTTASSPSSSLPTKDPEKISKHTPAYVVTLAKCDKDSVKFYLDAAAVLRHSIHQNSFHHLSSRSKYGYKTYAIINEICKDYAPEFHILGYTVLVKETPIDVSKIENKEYGDKLKTAGCCGEAEFIKLYAYTLTDHPVVVMLDLDTMIHYPMDDLFDAIIDDNVTGAIELEYPDDTFPKRVDAFFTRDYVNKDPWRKKAGVQSGFLVIRPDQKVFDEYADIIMKGNYMFNDDEEKSGWDGLGYGKFSGAMTMKGLVAYFYDHRHPGTAAELNSCRWNHDGGDNYYRERGEYNGKCRRYPKDGNFKRNEGCERCYLTPIEDVKTVHFTSCGKPWSCHLDKGFNCVLLYRDWFLMRKDFEDKLLSATGDESVISTRTGEFRWRFSLGYCPAENKYTPMVLPKEAFDVSKVYTIKDQRMDHPEPYEWLTNMGRAIDLMPQDDALKLRNSMREKQRTLKPPLWPQLDHKLSERITNSGIFLGPPNTPHVSTIVTAYYQFPSKHQSYEYARWFVSLLQSSEPMVIFLEPGTTWVDYVIKRRGHASTLVILLPIDQLIMSRSMSEGFWKQQNELKEIQHKEPFTIKNNNLFKIWNEKIALVDTVAKLNPFDTNLFAWFDAGHFRHGNIVAPGEPQVYLNITEAGVDPGSILFMHIRIPGTDAIKLAGNAFIGTALAFENIYKAYYRILWRRICTNRYIGDDQINMKETCENFPSYCHIHYPGGTRNWFPMAPLLKDSKRDKITTYEYPSLDKPSDNLMPFPTESINSTLNLKP